MNAAKGLCSALVCACPTLNEHQEAIQNKNCVARTGNRPSFGRRRDSFPLKGSLSRPLCRRSIFFQWVL